MKTEDRKQFGELFTRVSEIYEKKVSANLVGLYWDVLKDIKLEEVTKKAESHMKTKPFFPKPCDLRMTEEDEYNERLEQERQDMIAEGEKD